MVVPDPFASWHDARLTPTRFGPVQWFAAIDSTNRVLLEAGARGAAEGLVAVADEQTAGRGRLGRSWVAPPGASLLVSVLLRPQVDTERLALVTFAAGLAAVDAAREVAGIEAGLKWPNDVVVADRKLAGILAEKVGAVVVVGMGLNVRWESFPAELAEIATACNLCSDATVTREELLVRWLTRLDARLDDLPSVIDDARTRSATLGRRVRVELPGETFDADAVALAEDGQLVVRRDDGTSELISAADVIHLRAPTNGLREST
jgi:BirA family transcriptional regulator, biotin operon repressor / biotin---[acetyl-CoA-carboxylase] ligase